MKMRKRIFALLMALVVTFAMIPGAVYADWDTYKDTEGIETDITYDPIENMLIVQVYATEEGLLNENSMVQIVLSEYFNLGCDGTEEIMLEYQSYEGMDEYGYTYWGDFIDCFNNYVYIDEVEGRDAVLVSGFDFNNKKLIIHIPVTDNGNGCGSIPVISESVSAVYGGEEALETLSTPIADIPYFTVWHSSSQMYENIRINDAKAATGSSLFDITKPMEGVCVCGTSYTGVSEGYLYGGAFSDEGLGSVKTYDNDNGTVLCGAAVDLDKIRSGEIIYMKEVGNEYLQPKQLTLGGSGRICSTYFLTTVDCEKYRSVGFEVAEEENPDNCFKIAAGGSDGVIRILEEGEREGSDRCSVARTITASLSSGGIIEVNMENMIDWYHMDRGYVAAAGIEYDNSNGGLNVSKKTLGEGTYTVLPYWVTLDGVKVTGIQKRTLRYWSIGILDSVDLMCNGTSENGNPETLYREELDSETYAVEDECPMTELMLVSTLSAAPEKTVTVTAPAKVSLKSVKAGKKSLTVSWKKVKNAKGYQVKYKKSGSDTWKYVYVKSSVTSKKISKLAAGKKYTVKVRAYRTYTDEAGKTCKKYGKYSSVKTVRTLK